MHMSKLATLRQWCFAGNYEPAPIWRGLRRWLLVAFVLRAVLAIHGDFIIHPDEIFQYLEPAHWLVFGYGILPVEFFYGARSWLAPGMVASILWLSKSVGLGEPWFYIDAVKLLFCLLSLLIPWGVYHYSRRILSENAARLALILACIWPYLIAYAHKPLTEFIATNIFMGALGLTAIANLKQKWLVAVIGFLIAAVFLVRWQYLPVAFMLWFAVLISLQLRAALALVSGSLLATILVGLLEWFSWGGFFTSYFNNLYVNIALDLLRDPQPYHFYITRLIYATCGGILLSVWVMVKQPKTYLIIWVCMLALLLPHLFAEIKQFRFLFLLLVLSLIPIAGWTSRQIHENNMMALIKPAAAAGILSLAVLGNVFPYETWLHWAPSQVETRYWRGHSNKYGVYRQLNQTPNVTGVIHYSSNYLFSPAYYYLHKHIPFYDGYTALAIAERFDFRLRQLASHIVAPTLPAEQNEDFLLLQDGSEHKIYTSNDNSAVLPWKHHTIWNITMFQHILFASTLDDYRQIPTTISNQLLESDRP